MNPKIKENKKRKENDKKKKSKGKEMRRRCAREEGEKNFKESFFLRFTKVEP